MHTHTHTHTHSLQQTGRHNNKVWLTINKHINGTWFHCEGLSSVYPPTNYHTHTHTHTHTNTHTHTDYQHSQPICPCTTSILEKWVWAAGSFGGETSCFLRLVPSLHHLSWQRCSCHYSSSKPLKGHYVEFWEKKFKLRIALFTILMRW